MAGLLALLTGCAVGPAYQRPALDLPAAIAPAAVASADGGIAALPADGAAPRLSATLDVPAAWWQAFGSPQLSALVDACLQHNPSLAAADAALRAAQEQALAQSAERWPVLAASYGATRARVADPVASPLASNASRYTLHTAQVTVAYMPDVFGGLQRQLEAATAQADAQRFQLDAARLALTANAVAAAIDEAALRAQRDGALAVIASAQRLLQTAREQQRLGQLSQDGVDQQAALLAAAQAALPAIDKQLAAGRHLLAVLTGRYPGDGPAQAFDLAALTLPAELPLGLPAQLVAHRPDVRAAEAQLQAASAGIGVAVAALWPSVTLGVDAYGASALRLSDLFSPSTVFWTLTGGLAQPLFDAGALRHREAAARAAFDQAGAQYKATVLAAFQDVANALQAIASDTDALRIARAAAQASDASLARARRQWAAGDASADAVNVLEQAQAQAATTVALAQASRLADAAALFQALGGGGWPHGDAATAAATGP